MWRTLQNKQLRMLFSVQYFFDVISAKRGMKDTRGTI